MATRKAAVKIEKMSDTDLLSMVAKSTDNGFPVPLETLLSLSNRKTVARFFDTGLIEMHSTFYGAMYTISEAGRQAL